MRISVEVSMYPLTEQYIATIDRFIAALNEQKQVEVRTNGMSTQLFGEYEDVMTLFRDAVRDAMASGPKVVFAAKFLSSDVSGYGA